MRELDPAWPPGTFDSITRTPRPSDAPSTAAARPEGPAPTTRSAASGGTRGGVVPRDPLLGALGRAEWRTWTDLRPSGRTLRDDGRGLSRGSLALSLRALASAQQNNS